MTETLALCRQIIYEWETSQGRRDTMSEKSLNDNAEEVLKSALGKCSVDPSDENIKILDTCLELLYYKTCHNEE